MNINNIIFYILASSILALVLSFPIIHYLYKFKIVRLIDADYSAIIEKRRLKIGTPIMGGLVIVLTVLCINIIFNFNGTTKIPLLVFALSAILGAFDDVLNIYGRERSVRSIYRTLKLARVHANLFMRIFYIVTLPWVAYRWIFYLLGSNPGKGIQAHEKVLIQVLIGGIVGWWIYYKSGWNLPGNIWLPWTQGIDIGIWIIPFIILTIVTMTNAVNITDGMDGLSAALLVSAFTGFMIIAYFQRNMPVAYISASIVGALGIYLYFNIPPARFQMGDVGSLALGTLLATIAFSLNRAFLLPIFGFIFITEIGSVLLQGTARRLLGRRLLKMAPLHHHLEMIGWPEYKIVMRMWVIAPLLVILGIWLSQF
jgi:phospho-N-acetylmuramoyl-pentapeptide-transferase